MSDKTPDYFPKISIKLIPRRQIVLKLSAQYWLKGEQPERQDHTNIPNLISDSFLLYINRKKVRLFFGFCVVYTKTIIHLSSVLVKVVDIYLHFVQELLAILADCFCVWLFVFFL